MPLKTNTQEYSNREAMRLINENLQKHSSFAIETNLADLETWKFLLETQKTGYNINLVYLSTDNLDELNLQIEQRTQTGITFSFPQILFPDPLGLAMKYSFRSLKYWLIANLHSSLTDNYYYELWPWPCH